MHKQQVLLVGGPKHGTLLVGGSKYRTLLVGEHRTLWIADDEFDVMRSYVTTFADIAPYHRVDQLWWLDTYSASIPVFAYSSLAPDTWKAQTMDAYYRAIGSGRSFEPDWLTDMAREMETA